VACLCDEAGWVSKWLAGEVGRGALPQEAVFVWEIMKIGHLGDRFLRFNIDMGSIGINLCNRCRSKIHCWSLQVVSVVSGNWSKFIQREGLCR